MRINEVEEFPEEKDMQNGTIYISRLYKTSSHKCFCGCGNIVVMPFGRANSWQLTENENGKLSFYPSVGNWSFPCKSHYWIKNGKVVWNEDGPPYANLRMPALERFKRYLQKLFR